MPSVAMSGAGAEEEAEEETRPPSPLPFPPLPRPLARSPGGEHNKAGDGAARRAGGQTATSPPLPSPPPARPGRPPPPGGSPPRLGVCPWMLKGEPRQVASALGVVLGRAGGAGSDGSELLRCERRDAGDWEVDGREVVGELG